MKLYLLHIWQDLYSPIKGLVQEKLRDWNHKFGSWGINCLELTGDSEIYNPRNIQEADIILTTPEKFDAVTRYRIRDGGLSFFSDIGLLLIDEVHLLNDQRGASLEAIVSRIKMLSHKPEIKSSTLGCVRLVAVSATIPNIGDLAEWLMAPSQGIKRFGEEMRPVKLTTRVFGYAPAKNDFLFERRLQSYVFDILMQHSRGKSALVFCSTRKGAQDAALQLSQTAMTFGHSNPFMKSREQQERLKEASLSCSDKQMQSCIPLGVGYHHGGLSLKDRNLVEGLFLRGDLQVLCTTNTLAHGINLPAHTVVIKSTQNFNKERGMYLEYDRSMILQMCGRAGRPPFDDTGMVVIMTRKDTVHLYENLLGGCEVVESQLLSCVTEHLAAEIVQLTITDITRAIEWMKCSYLYVRMKKNPENYGIKKKIPGDCIEKHIQEICVQKVNELSKHGMIWMDEYGFLLKPLEPGNLMTKYYLKFETMKNIMQTPERCSLEDALNIICRSEEIAWIQLRRNEKKLLNDINTDKEGRLRFHILTDNGKRKKRIQTREDKIFVLANDCLTGDPLCHDLSFSQDMNSICSNGCRIARCMKEYFIHKKSYKGLLNCSLLAKCLDQKLWDDSPYMLKQLPGIGMVTAKALNSAGINSFETLAEADPRRIEILTGRKFPFGNHIKESLLSLPPKVEMKVEEKECHLQGKSKIAITLTRKTQSVSSAKRHCADMVLASEEDNLILFHEKIRMNEFSSPYSTEILVSTPRRGKLTVRADLIFEEYIGLDLYEKHFVERTSGSTQRSSFSFDLSKEIYTVEDDGERATSETRSDEDHILYDSKKATSSMPSFKLLDEDFDEDVSLFEIEESGCDSLTEHTIFDHIRRKAKDFPVISPSTSKGSLTSGILGSLKRRLYDKGTENHTSTEIPDNDTDDMQRETVFISDSESGDAEKGSYGTDENVVPMYPINTRISRGFDKEVTQKDGLATDCKERSSKAVTQDAIFDQIRKKAKKFPEFTTSKVTEPESSLPESEYFYKAQSKFPDTDYPTSKSRDSESLLPVGERSFKEQFEIPHSVETSRGTDFSTQRKPTMLPDSKLKKVEHCFRPIKEAKETYRISSGRLGERTRSPSISPKVSGLADNLTEMKVPSSTSLRIEEDNLCGHKRRASFPVKSSAECRDTGQPGPNGSEKQPCALEIVRENREVQSFLGFKSVFSFL